MWIIDIIKSLFGIQKDDDDQSLENDGEVDAQSHRFAHELLSITL